MSNSKITGVIVAFMIACLVGLAGCVDQTFNSSVSDLSNASGLQSESGAVANLSANAEHTGRYIVMARNKNQLQSIINSLNAAGGTVVHELAEVGAVIVQSSDAGFKNRAARVNGVRSVIPDLVYQFNLPEPHGEVSVQSLGDPPNSGSADFFFDLQWGHNAVRAHHAWAEGIRGQGVRVAVLDNGFDLAHPDLVPNINFGLSANFVEGESLQYGLPDAFSHGSHVAGIIAAAQNDFGVIGVAPDAELVLVKVISDAGLSSWSNVAFGIIHAALAEADVINMSLGGAVPQRGFSDNDITVSANEVAELRVFMTRVINFANQSGSTVITSAGNAALNRDRTKDLLNLPADLPNVISISATAPVGWATDPENINLDNLASYSNYGRSAIDFAAPGGDSIYPGNENCTIAGLLRPCWVFDLVFSTGNAGWYWSQGTSMASPHAAGIAALIISENGGSMHPSQVEAELRKRADRIDTGGRSTSFGLGRVSSGY